MASKRRAGGRQGVARAYDVPALRRFAGLAVRVHLRDGAAWTGRLRTDLLSERSISVYVDGAAGEGATLYIDQIAEIVPLPLSPQ